MTALMSACVVVVVAMVAGINLALPELAGSDLHPSSTGLLWIVDAYILTFGCLLIPAGALADRFGRKGVLLAGLGTFTIGCLTSAAAPTVALLLAARAVTGVGAALVMPATLSLLLQVTPLERKPRAIATWSAATGAAGALDSGRHRWPAWAGSAVSASGTRLPRGPDASRNRWRCSRSQRRPRVSAGHRPVAGSRAGRRLRELGLATRVRAGRLNGWTLTQSGERAVTLLRTARS